MKKITLILLLLVTFFSFSQTIDTGFSKKIRLAEKLTKSFLEKEQIPGMSISLSKKGKLIWSEGFGFSNIEKKKKVDPSETQFRIASISKTLTAIALAKLVDDKRLNLDGSLYDYVPDFPIKKYDFTIRQLGGAFSWN
jgi:CubicO group peptidase (beta-lactamase class C family)